MPNQIEKARHEQQVTVTQKEPKTKGINFVHSNKTSMLDECVFFYNKVMEGVGIDQKQDDGWNDKDQYDCKRFMPAVLSSNLQCKHQESCWDNRDADPL